MLPRLRLIDLVRVVLRYTLQLPALIVLLPEHVDQFVSVNVLIDFKLFDLLFELFEPLSLLVLVLVKSLTVRFDLLHLLLELLNDLLSGRKRLLCEQELLFQDDLPLFRLSHLIPQVSVVRQLLLHQVDLVLILLLSEHLFRAPEQSLLSHDFAHSRQLEPCLLF